MCVQEPCVYLLSPPSVVIWNNSKTIVLVIFEKLPRFWLSSDWRQIFRADHFRKCSSKKVITIGKIKECNKTISLLFLLNYTRMYILTEKFKNRKNCLNILCILLFVCYKLCNIYIIKIFKAWAWKFILKIIFYSTLSETKILFYSTVLEMNKRIIPNNFFKGAR